jgi:hypothetical protein
MGQAPDGCAAVPRRYVDSMHDIDLDAGLTYRSECEPEWRDRRIADSIARRVADGILWHPHLLWLLLESVSRPREIFRSLLHDLTAALVPYGADAGGMFNPMG